MYKIVSDKVELELQNITQFRKSAYRSPIIYNIRIVTYTILNMLFTAKIVEGRGRVGVYGMTLRDYVSKHKISHLSNRVIAEAIEDARENYAITVTIDGKKYDSTETLLSMADVGTIEYNSYRMVAATRSRPFTRNVSGSVVTHKEEYLNSYLFRHTSNFVEYNDQYTNILSANEIVVEHIATTLLEVYYDLSNDRKVDTISGIIDYMEHLEDFDMSLRQAKDTIKETIEGHTLWDRLSYNEIVSYIATLPEDDREDVVISNVKVNKNVR